MSRRSTESLLSLLDAAAPGFRAWSLSGDNLFDLDSLHGVMLCPEHQNRTRKAIDAGAPAFDRICVVKGLTIEELAVGSEVWCAEWLVAEAGDPLDDRPGTGAR